MSKHEHVEKGPGLARGPALLMGVILAAAGLLLFLKAGNTPTNTFPDGTQNGKNLLGFEANGWTAWFTTVAGVLLLFGAAQHLLAKTMSLLVGLALGACSVIALTDGDDVLGLAAANGPVKLAWGVAAAILLVISLLPRVRHKSRGVRDEPGVERPARRGEAGSPPASRRSDAVEPQRTEVIEPRRTDAGDTHPVDARPDVADPRSTDPHSTRP